MVIDVSHRGLRAYLLMDRTDNELLAELRRLGTPTRSLGKPAYSNGFWIPVSAAARLWEKMKEAVEAHVSRSFQEVRVTQNARSHSPGVLEYAEGVLGRELPRPALKAKETEPTQLPRHPPRFSAGVYMAASALSR